MDPMLLRRQTTRFNLMTLQRLAMLTVVTKLEWFSNNLELIAILAPCIRLQLAEFIQNYMGYITPVALPLLLALGIQSIHIDFTLPAGQHSRLWSLNAVTEAFSQIAAHQAQVVNIHFEFYEMYSRSRRNSWCFPRRCFHRMLANMPQLQELTLSGNCQVDQHMFDHLCDTIQSICIRSTLNCIQMNDGILQSIVSRKSLLVKLDLLFASNISPLALLNVLETLPDLEILKHIYLEQALHLYSARHGLKPLKLTYITLAEFETIEEIIPLVPFLRDVTFYCNVPSLNFQLWQYITSLTFHQNCENIDDLIKLWGGQLIKLHIAPTQAVSCRQIVTICKKLEYLLLGKIADSREQLEIPIPNKFEELSRFFYLPAHDLYMESQPTFWLTLFLSAPNLKKVVLNRVNVEFMLPILRSNSFCNLKRVTLKNCVNQKSILEWIFSAPYIKAFYLNNCEGQTLIHRNITRNCLLKNEVTMIFRHSVGTKVVDIFMKKPNL